MEIIAPITYQNRICSMECSPADLAGPRNRVSFCLYGDNPKYVRGAIENVPLVQKYYPGWEPIFYTKNVDQIVLDELRVLGATVVECDYRNMMIARFLPFCEPGVVLSRDCDSRISPREVRAVSEWLETDKVAHVIRDHPDHIADWAPILGGLWGSRAPFPDEFKVALEHSLNDPRYSGWGGDQQWLADIIWRPEAFSVHQYNRVDWMRESWSPNDFCGMQYEVTGPVDARDVILFEGFFNRLNGLVNGLLTHGKGFRARWSVNSHLPHRFEELFDDMPGVMPLDTVGLDYWKENTDPQMGPLCYWYLSKTCGANAEQVEAAYRYFISKMKVDIDEQPPPLGVHYRGFHRSARVEPEAFARWCLFHARKRNATICFAIADRDRESIQAILEEGGVTVRWGKSSPLDHDLDRGDLHELRKFIADVITLAHCGTVLTSFDETTIVDPARALGREVIAFSGSRAWSKCWFQHADCCKTSGPSLSQDDVSGSCVPTPTGGLDQVFGALYSQLESLRSSNHHQYLYGTHLDALKVILDALRPAPGESLMEIGGGDFSTSLLLASGTRVFTLEQGQNVPPEINASWLERLRVNYQCRRNWRLLDHPGTESWRKAIFPAGLLFCFVDGNGDCRKEIVEFMLERKIPVIAAHDSETPSFRYDQIACPPDYCVYDYRGREVWTRVWSRSPKVNLSLDRHPDFSPLGNTRHEIDLRDIPSCPGQIAGRDSSFRRKVVFVQAQGRTGNQLFQYAYGLHLSRKFNCDLFGNLSLLAGIEGVPVELTHSEWLGNSPVVESVADDIAERWLSEPEIAGLRLQGYFQTHEHIAGMRAHLNGLLGSVPKRNTIGIHVRRGDYVDSGFDMKPSLAYFKSGVKRIQSGYPGPFEEILIFSDDPDWCRTNLSPYLDSVLPTRVFHGDTIATLTAMKSMRAMIITNSTFGWWGAWLADCPTIHPDVWQLPGSELEAGLGCIRPDWHALPISL